MSNEQWIDEKRPCVEEVEGRECSNAISMELAREPDFGGKPRLTQARPESIVVVAVLILTLNHPHVLDLYLAFSIALTGLRDL